MHNFNSYRKKDNFTLPDPVNFEFGKKIKLISPVSIYEIGSTFTIVETKKHDFQLNLLGIGETFLQDEMGKVVKINGSKNIVGNLFESVIEIPQPIIEDKKQIETIVETVVGQKGDKGDQGDRGLTGPMGPIGPQGPKGDKGDTGERGETGWTGWPGDKGEQGVQGEKGEKGDKGDQGERGEKGDRGEPGSQGDKGEKGDAGDKGEKGDKGERGDRGDVGQQGERGEKGDQGEKGDKGDQGEPGLSGRDGKDGIAGEKGEKGDKGDTGERGERGEKGDKGDTGDSGIVSVSYPLAYEDVSKHLSFDNKFLEEFNTKISSEISKVAYSSGGGGNVDLYVNGEKAVKNLRSINFTGSGVTVTPDGIKATINITGGSEPSPEGLPNPPYVTNVELTDGNLIVTYNNNSTSDLGDVLDVDGGTF